MKDVSLRRLEDLLSEATTELFGYYGAALAGSRLPEPFPPGMESLAATIGFTSPRMRGALIMTAGKDIVRKSCPAEIGASPNEVEILADWTGELSNQLLGRLKVKLLGRGISISLSTPVVFVGEGMSHFPQHPSIGMDLVFSALSGSVEVEFQAQSDEGFEIPEAAESNEGLSEGGISLF